MNATPDSALANPEQLIADLQRQLVECRAKLDKAQRRLDERTTERDEALAQQTATAEVLQVINTSPGALAPVFDAILGRALNLCGAAFGYMLSCDGEAFRRVASRGSSPALDAALPPPGPTPGSLAERFVRGENIIRSTNLVKDRRAGGACAGRRRATRPRGQIGFSDRSGYTAIGTVCNLAARLCAEAKDGQILVSSRVARAVEAIARLEDLGNLELKGLRRPVAAFNVVQSTSQAEARPNLTVVARGPGA